MNRQPGTQPSRGLTMTELLITMAVSVILLAMAVPSMYEFVMRKRVQGAADELIGDLRFARSAQVRDNRDIAVKFGRTGSETCYVVYQPTSRLDCDCTATPVCESRGPASAIELKTVRLPISAGVKILPANGSDTKLVWDLVTGLAKDNVAINVEVLAASGGTVRITTSVTGRPQICSVSGHQGAYPACQTPTPSPS
ncbi:pilus assembly FimT family protein [Aquabacterium sp. OR-4]|uniref:pilus assembly FimT family protein n=1 Tax=Aquabacterium sp. OR-4 TaxID=2978127 RepID=UPI0021B4BBEE|nr:GspH/FimT family pseudopilin [Aquabacterium sp. OR-4]MDT7836350.1 prepilin-type N-terminal cleavage/methylation domain-containing protein [Aquabacterium sp. OR-4]